MALCQTLYDGVFNTDRDSGIPCHIIEKNLCSMSMGIGCLWRIWISIMFALPEVPNKWREKKEKKKKTLY